MKELFVAFAFTLFSLASNAGTIVSNGQREYLVAYNPSNSPVSIQVMVQAIHKAGRAWEACGVKVTYVGTTYQVAGTKDSVNVIGWTSSTMNASANGIGYGQADAQTIAWGNIVTTEADILLSTKTSLDTVLTHEIGHVFGLAHTSDTTSIMFPRNLGVKQPTASDIASCL